MRQELIDLLQELEILGRQAAHSFVKNVAHEDMDLNDWERLQDCLREMQSKANSANLLTMHLRHEENGAAG
jgi:hypothetical protein